MTGEIPRPRRTYHRPAPPRRHDNFGAKLVGITSVVLIGGAVLFVASLLWRALDRETEFYQRVSQTERVFEGISRAFKAPPK